MIFNELKTAFRWYDDIYKQNRYKDTCVGNCDYKFISPVNKIPPFQFDTRNASFVGDISDLVHSWEVVCAQDDIPYLNLPVIGLSFERRKYKGITSDLIVYNGFSIPGLLLPCSTYYLHMVTEYGDFYSEIFTAVDFIDNTYTETQKPLFTAWRWYDDIDKSERYKERCTGMCEYYLLTGSDLLIPFQFRIPRPGFIDIYIVSWKLISADGSCEYILDHTLIEEFDNGVDWLYYTYQHNAGPLPCGKFYSIIEFVTGQLWYSEPIEVINTISTGTDGDFLLQENTFLILQDSGSRIIIES